MLQNESTLAGKQLEPLFCFLQTLMTRTTIYKRLKMTYYSHVDPGGCLSFINNIRSYNCDNINVTAARISPCLCRYVESKLPHKCCEMVAGHQRNINGVSGSGENRDQQVIYNSVGAAGVS